MDKTYLVYRCLLSQLRGEHFAKVAELPNKAELLNMANGFVKLNAEHFTGRTVEFTDEFDVSVKSYLYEKGFFEMIKGRWNVTDEQIIERGLVELPTYIENRLICHELQKVFGRWIFGLPVFQSDELKYDQRKFRRGFMRPINHRSEIIGFEVFRTIKDQNPIALMGIGNEEARG